MDFYGCTLWNFGSNYVETCYNLWRKAIRPIWKLTLKTYWNLLHGIKDTFAIDVMLEQRCIKLIWTLLHCPNIIVKSVMRSAIRNGYSVLGEHFRYLSYKYDLSPTSWISQLCKVYTCINEYITDFIVTPDISYFIRELCICRYSEDLSVLTSTVVRIYLHGINIIIIIIII